MKNDSTTLDGDESTVKNGIRTMGLLCAFMGGSIAFLAASVLHFTFQQFGYGAWPGVIINSLTAVGLAIVGYAYYKRDRDEIELIGALYE